MCGAGPRQGAEGRASVIRRAFWRTQSRAGAPVSRACGGGGR